MAKNNIIPQLLLLTLICIHLNFNGHHVASVSYRSLLVNNQVHGNGRQGAKRSAVKTQTKDEATAKKASVKKVYDAQIGVREQGINSGIAVERYLHYVGLKKGEPWCAAFICWVYGQANITNPRTGWSPDLFSKSTIIWNRGNEIKQPNTADIFALYFPEKGRIAHAGFIDNWDGNWLITVEGNTNNNGSRDGDGVYRKRRMVKSIYKVARYIH